MTHKWEKIAGMIRICTIPPIMAAVLLIMLVGVQTDAFGQKEDYIVAWVGLVILPLLAYPLSKLIPAVREKGRSGQRKLAFLCSLAGYTMCFFWGLLYTGRQIKILFYTYFFTVVMLTVFNLILKIRASGHAASAIAPCVWGYVYVNVIAGCIMGKIFLISAWASIALKRHKLTDIVAGGFVFAVSYMLAILL